MKISITIFVLPVATLLAQQYTISTIAGNGRPPSSVAVVSVRVPTSGAIALSNTGDVYFASGNSVLKVDAKGILTRVAGTGTYGSAGDGGPAFDAQLAWPAGLALDQSGNLYIADNAAHRIRKVSFAGIISTVAGTGKAGNSGDNGPATSAQLNWPTALAVDASGSLYIADTGNRSIRRVSSDGTITTVPADLHNAQGVAVDGSGNLYITDYVVVTNDDGDDLYSGRVLRITASGTTDTITPEGGGVGLSSPRGIALDAAGDLYVADSVAGKVFKVSAGLITIAADFSVTLTPDLGSQLAAVAVDSLGNLYISDTRHSRIAKISPQGAIANIVGDGTPGNYWGDGGKASEAGLSTPLGLALDRAGNLYVSDTGNSRVRKVSPDGTITTVAGNGTFGYSGDGGPATSAQLKGPAGLAVDASGNLYIADRTDNRIRKVSTDGIITTVAGRGDFNPPLGDGGPATKGALAGPLGIAVDASGNLYIADSYFFLIRKVSAAGIITTIAGNNFYQPGPYNLGLPTSIAMDAGGSLYVASLSIILKFSPDGTISTVAGNGATGTGSGDGGPATNATLQGPFAVALDAAGNLYICGGSLSGYALFGAGYVRRVTPVGIITTVAGNGTTGYSGDGGLATSASFSAAAGGIAVDPGGTIYVADTFNNVIRAMRPAGQ